MRWTTAPRCAELQQLTIDVVANDTDADDTPIIWAVTSSPSHGSVYCGGSLCHYTAQTGYVGSDAFSYEIRDGHGGSDTATVTLTVDANEAPVANGDTIEVRGTESGSVGVLANDTDAEADPLTVVDHSGATHGNVWCTTGGSCTYQSTDPLFAGGDSFTYALSDGHGGSVTGTVTVTVAENAQPVVTDDELTVTDTESGSVDVLANDTDADDTLSISSHTQPTSGSVWCSGGVLPLHPDRRHRGHGGQLHLHRHRRPRRDRHRDRVHHDRPQHPAGSGGRHRHDPGRIPAAVTVLDNDTDADGDGFDVSDWTQGLQGGEVTCNIYAPRDGRSCTYTAPADFVGDDTFTYTVTDDRDGRATATVTVTVTANAAPVVTGETLASPGPAPARSRSSTTTTMPTATPCRSPPTGQPGHGSASCTGDGHVLVHPGERVPRQRQLRPHRF